LKKVSFNNKNNSFSEAINSDVKAYFESTGRKQTGDWRLFIKSFTLIPATIGLYILLLMNVLPAVVAILGCMVLGILIASIGFSVMHDACHGSYSTSKRINYIMGLTMNALGANAFIWKVKHNIIHHTYTNIDGVDDDIAKSPVLRHCYSQTYKPIHRYQHIYMIPLYAISSMLWALYTDLDKYFKREINGTPINHFPLQEHILFWVSKALYIVFYMAIPIYFVGFTPFLIGYLTMSATLGLALSFVFQLAHVVETTEFVDALPDDSKHSIEDSWAIHQIKTTSNFAMNSKLISWFVGGLNFQIEHHLYPKISHVHYPALSKIVQARCKEYGLRYNNIPTFGAAIASHYRLMRTFGQTETAPQVMMAA
jgi:linoleoyl-CoA desaturase